MPIGPGALPRAIEDATQRARAAGALHSFESVQHVIEEAGVSFLVRELTRAAREEFSARRRRADTSQHDPFLPYDPNLFVADLSATHVVLLNKFNLSAHHVVVATREFKLQETLLDASDFAAIAAALLEVDGLVFYNGGETAGASQQHKHLQMLPVPLEGSALATPIDAAIEEVRGEDGVIAIPALAFRHAFAWIPSMLNAAVLAQMCDRLLARIGVRAVERDGERFQSSPWNLLVTRRWMLAVPRTKAEFRGVPVNAVGFAGSLFVRDDAQLATVKRAGPMKLLAGVA